MKWLFEFVMVASVVGCGGTTKIDGTSQATIQASMVNITKGMTPEEKEQFTKDCMAVSMGDADSLMEMAASTNMMAAKLDGMTLEQIRTRAAAVRAKHKEKLDKDRAAIRQRTKENWQRGLDAIAAMEKQGPLSDEMKAEKLKAEAELKKLEAAP